jgi:inorganic pyrophosphatase
MPNPRLQLLTVPACKPQSSLVRVVVDTPKPWTFGLNPSTRGEDGDPLDFLVVSDQALFTGCVVEIPLLGVIEARQLEQRKLFAEGPTAFRGRFYANLDAWRP